LIPSPARAHMRYKELSGRLLAWEERHAHAP